MSEAAISFPMLGEGFSLDFPTYFTVFGWRVHWYGVIIAVGFVLAVLYGIKRAPRFGLKDDDVYDMLVWAVPLAVICARLYYVVFFRDSAGNNPYFDGRNDLKEIVAIWEGGLAIYGGVIGGAAGVLLSMRRKRRKTRPMLDVGGLGLLIGQAVGRWGNFVNREAFGAETTLPWRMGLSGAWGTAYYHPTFLYESLWNLLGLLLLHLYTKKRRFDGQIFLMYLGWYGLGRAFIEALRTDSLYLGGTGLRVSQLLGAAAFAVSAGILLYVLLVRRPDPGKMFVNSAAAEAGAEINGGSEESGDARGEKPEADRGASEENETENAERTMQSGKGEQNG
ncbi:MAG: prolipoprotein diacylglyceryl transferase [Oscillospiraceae bacterium]|nr:prolipoprotein diacylglyceryl transferase [Oscillospiraceae bacterium]